MRKFEKQMAALFLIFICFTDSFAQTTAVSISTDVLIIGGGASGTMAGIQAARLGTSTIIIEETPWLGGMLTAAGVSAIDGNYKLSSGLWEEFRQKLGIHYNGVENLKTGWVSNVLFEPQVGFQILTEMTNKEENLTVFLETKLKDIIKKKGGWETLIVQNNNRYTIEAKIVIDATELGDVAKQVGVPYDIGMDSRFKTGEDIALEKANNIIQDLTYVAILKDYGTYADVTIPRPIDYDPTPFLCTCAGSCEENSNKKLWDCDVMMKYGKLPNGYYMINWPIYGNDYYVNLIELSDEERTKELKKAKSRTLHYVYYLQNELGFRNLGIADDVYPTLDGLPFIPYHRESRRIQGIVQFTINDIAKPFSQSNALYRTGIAVGDYPIDHHHQAYSEADSLPNLRFYPVPSYNLPLGTLIPKEVENFIVAEKSISVSNIANGTTRLQPVCILIGQAAGTLAALAIKNKTTPKNISIREVQNELLNTGAYIMPYSDVGIGSPEFKALQRLGATGILRGDGKNIGWENHTYIYPDSLLSASDLKKGLSDWLVPNKINYKNEMVTYKEALETIKILQQEYDKKSTQISIKSLDEKTKMILKKHNLPILKFKSPVKRAVFAILMDELINPFQLRDVNHFGSFIH